MSKTEHDVSLAMVRQELRQLLRQQPSIMLLKKNNMHLRKLQDRVLQLLLQHKRKNLKRKSFGTEGRTGTTKLADEKPYNTVELV